MLVYSGLSPILFCQFGLTSNELHQENAEVAMLSNTSRYHSRVRQHESRTETATYTRTTLTCQWSNCHWGRFM